MSDKPKPIRMHDVVMVPLTYRSHVKTEQWSNEFEWTLKMELPWDISDAHELIGEIAHMLGCAGYNGKFETYWAHEKFVNEFDADGISSSRKISYAEACEHCGRTMI